MNKKNMNEENESKFVLNIRRKRKMIIKLNALLFVFSSLHFFSFSKPTLLCNKQIRKATTIILKQTYRNHSYPFEVTSTDPLGGDVKWWTPLHWPCH
jgi:hypothetical protein